MYARLSDAASLVGTDQNLVLRTAPVCQSWLAVPSIRVFCSVQARRVPMGRLRRKGDPLLGRVDEVENLDHGLARGRSLSISELRTSAAGANVPSRAEVLTASRRIVGRATSIGFGRSSLRQSVEAPEMVAGADRVRSRSQCSM